jgi:dihydroflavonol-4-reductase
MKTLITGATGFVGSAVLRQLLKAGHDVRVLVRISSDHRNIAGLPVEIVHGDLNDRSSLVCALRGCQTLFHVAADYRLWVPKPDEIYETNVKGTVNIMQAAAEAGVERIVYTSSVATLGLTSDGSPADESTAVSLHHMIGHYKRSKFMAEEKVRRMVEDMALPVVIVNPSAPVGPRDIKSTPTGKVILQAAAGRMPAYVDTGLNLVHVDDVAIGHLLAFEHGLIGERYILGAQNMTLKDILTELASITGQRMPWFRLPHNVVLPIAYIVEALALIIGSYEPMVTVDGVKLSKKRMFFSSEKARRELGFKTRPVREALWDAVHWFKQNAYLP